MYVNNIVTYRDQDHTYWCQEERYLSATQVLDLFKNKFDANGAAIAFAEKHGASAETWKQRWDIIRSRSLVRGNGIHDAREQMTLSRGMERYREWVLPVPNPALYRQDTPLIQMPDGVYTEQLLYHHGFKIAGRCDKVILVTKGGKRYAYVVDYKTNRIIRMRGYRYKDGTRQMMLAPLDHLEDCHIIHYTLQISEYLLMLESMGFIAGGGEIVHFPHIPEMAPPGAKPPTPVTYAVEYRKNDVTSMLQQLTNGKIPPSTAVPFVQ